MNMINLEIKRKIKKLGLHQYEVADKMGIAETTLVRWLRYELDPDKRDMIQGAINELIIEKE